MAPRKPSPAELSFLMIWHGVLSGGLLIAFITAEASYAMHVFSGAIVLSAIVVRVMIGLAVPPGTPLSLGGGILRTLSTTSPLGSFLGQSKKLLKDVIAIVLLISIGLSALSGWLIFDMGGENDFHEGVVFFAATVVFVHIALVVIFHSLKRSSKSVKTQA